MKNIFKSLIYIAVLSFFVISCDEDKTTFDPLNFPTDAFVAFGNGSIGVDEFNTDDIVITISLATVNQNDNVTVGFDISSPDAILGTHYEVVDNKTEFTIAAGEYTSDELKIRLIDNIENEENKAITITLMSASNGAILGFPGPDSNGSKYVINILDDDCPKEEALRPFEGTWSGTDNCGQYASQTSTELACEAGILIKGIGHGWLEDSSFWDEVVVVEHEAFLTIDEAAGTVDIPQQLYVTTTWLGNVQPDYFLVGSGTIDTSGASPVMHIEYDLIQVDGSGSMVARGGTTCSPLFVQDITLD